MLVKGKVQTVFAPVSGVSMRGTEWHSQEFVFAFKQSESDMFTERMVLRIFGEDKIKKANLQVGDEYEIGFTHDVRERGGRYYNDVNIGSMRKMVEPTPTAIEAKDGEKGTEEVAEAAPVPTVPEPTEENANDLPF